MSWLVGILLTSSALSADLGGADLPRIHSEYKANQARWAREFLDKTFAATMTLEGVSNVFGNDQFLVSFLENPSDWMAGIQCRDVPPSDFLINKNKGDPIFLRGVVKDHSFGSLDLRDCEFFDSERAAADADAAARAQEAKQASSDEAKQVAAETAALDASARAAAASGPEPPAATGQFQLQTLLLPATLNDKFRGMIQRTGKRCNAITDHVWVTTEHISVMCDRRFRAAFIHEADSWRFGRPGE